MILASGLHSAMSMDVKGSKSCRPEALSPYSCNRHTRHGVISPDRSPDSSDLLRQPFRLTLPEVPLLT